ncbi:Crp/Fnr family transcriptional regulator [Panacibacter sp. DH6]|uniref:Crp/Fnr family transcriptional regulator n=1 Tax=Panacibacter microcysteis TaxID=2793269 RepID=A0A931GZP3_9BACT|nr:Crp/Fnr family transcriptional regulator [Panacibacter microcysteis]MBG9378297.1 Crp/Fnr family transcriptional regulator [Panacibacter microcysteis]
MKESKKQCDLNTCMMCRLCMKEWKPALAASRSNYTYRKGELIFKEGDAVRGVYFINEGTVKVHKQWGDKELILRLANSGAIAGHRGLGGDFIYPVSATALGTTEVCFFDLDFFRATIKVNHDLSYELIMFLAGDLKESEQNMRNLVHMPVKNRIAQALIALENKFGVRENGIIDIDISRQDLASFVGTTYETLFRMLNELIEEGLIKADGRHLQIIDKNRVSTLTQWHNNS